MTPPRQVDPDRLHGLLRALMDEYSPSGKEQDAVDVAWRALHDAGLPVTRLPVGDPADERDNLLVLPPSGEADVVFVGHLDTVPAYDIEDYAYQLDADGDTIHGLGAADMKGGCAAMIEAFVAYTAGHFSDADADAVALPAALALVVGEEETGDGVRSLLDEHGFTWALVGEPTDLQACLGCWSYVEAILQARGKRAHAALGNAANNAIQTLLHRLLRATQYLDVHPAGPVYNLRDLNSSHGGFAVPDHCQAAMDLHLPPRAPLGELITAFEEHLLADLEPAVRDRVEVRFDTIDAGFQLPDRGALPSALRQSFDAVGLAWSPSAFRSHSDANQLWAAGVRPLVCGPGRLDVAHTADEQVSFTQVQTAASLYLGLLRSLSD